MKAFTGSGRHKVTVVTTRRRIVFNRIEFGVTVTNADRFVDLLPERDQADYDSACIQSKNATIFARNSDSSAYSSIFVFRLRGLLGSGDGVDTIDLEEPGVTTIYGLTDKTFVVAFDDENIGIVIFIFIL
jgi:hypothetical protein